MPVAPAPGPQAEVSYLYYNDGRLRTLSVPGTDYNFAYSYDGMGRLKTISEIAHWQDNYYQYSYDDSSNVTGRTSHANDTSLSFVRDELNRITEETILTESGPFSQLHYRYDTMSRLTSTLREEDGRLDSFAYDFTGELKSAQYGLQPDDNGGFNNPEAVAGYAYDNAGNRLLVNGVTYTPNVLNQYTLAQGAPVGNGSYHEINSYQGVSYSYLADTQLAAVSSTAGGSYGLGYDALGRTVRRTANGQATYFIYDGARSILEYDASGNMIASTLYGLGVDEIIARNNNGAGQFLMQDRMGSTVAVTGWKGELLEQYRYDAFGKPKIMDPDGTVLTDTAINNRFLFTGREWVSRFGFYEYRARAYHPGLGRFMSQDPLGFAAGDANLYRYVGNDPVNRTDPTGLVEPQEVECERVCVVGSPLPPYNPFDLYGGGVPGAGPDEPYHPYYDPEVHFTSIPQIPPYLERPPEEEGVSSEAEASTGPTYDSRTESSIASLLPQVQVLAYQHMALAIAAGIDMRIISGTRSYAEQNALYAQGRPGGPPGGRVTNARGGYSNHNFGVAYDVAIFNGSTPIYDGPGYDVLGQLGQSIGLEWGGNWSTFVDRPHFQYTGGLAVEQMRQRVAAGLPPIP